MQHKWNFRNVKICYIEAWTVLQTSYFVPQILLLSAGILVLTIGINRQCCFKQGFTGECYIKGRLGMHELDWGIVLPSFIL